MENRRINSFFKIDKRKVKIKTGQYRCLSHNNEMKYMTLESIYVHISKMEN